MQKFSPLLPGALLATAVLSLFHPRALGAQPTETPLVTKAASPEELSPNELLKSYFQLRDQLQATQVAITNNRLEAENASRLQASTIADRLEAITAAMEAERNRHRVEIERYNTDRERSRAELQRLEAERDHRQTELEQSNRMVLWIAVALGGIGLISMVLTPLFHWRTVNRMTQLVASHPQLATGTHALAAKAVPGLSDQTVAVSNQRLLSTLDRLEQRVRDFEHTSVAVAPIAPANGGREIELARRTSVTTDQASRIRVLLAKGQSLLDLGKAVEAMTCYNDVLRLEPTHPEALVRRGAALERLKQDDEAIQCYDQAIKSNRKMTLAYLHKGAVCNRLERYEEAVKCYEQALLVEAES